MSAILGPSVKIIDSGPAVARQVKRILISQNLLSQGKKGRHFFLTTGNPKEFQPLVSQRLGFFVKAKN